MHVPEARISVIGEQAANVCALTIVIECNGGLGDSNIIYYVSKNK